MTPEQYRALKPGDLVRHRSGALGVVVGHQIMNRNLARNCQRGDAQVIQWVTGGTQWALACCPSSVPPIERVEMPACRECGGWIPPTLVVPDYCGKCANEISGPVAEWKGDSRTPGVGCD